MTQPRLVYPATEDQNIYRTLTRESKLNKWLTYDLNVNLIPEEVVFPYGCPEYVRGYSAKGRRELIQDIFSRYGGINLCSGYIPGNRGASGIRLQRHYADRGEHPVAYDLITAGAGILRPSQLTDRTSFGSALKTMGEEDLRSGPKLLESSYAVKQQCIAYYSTCTAGENHDVREKYEATNYVYGDVYGELEQLIRRRHDTPFIRRYLTGLHEVWNDLFGKLKFVVIEDRPNSMIDRLQSVASQFDKGITIYHVPDPQKGREKVFITISDHHYEIDKKELLASGFVLWGGAVDVLTNIGSQPKGACLYLQHLADRGIWKQPPADVNELVSRVRHLLDEIMIDSQAYYRKC